MQKLTLAALAAIAVALSLAVLPALTSSAMAAKPTPPGGTECVHNGNGRTTEGACENGNSGNTVITTCEKVRGKYVCTTQTVD